MCRGGISGKPSAVNYWHYRLCAVYVLITQYLEQELFKLPQASNNYTQDPIALRGLGVPVQTVAALGHRIIHSNQPA